MSKSILLYAFFLCMTVSQVFSQIIINPQVGVHNVSFERAVNYEERPLTINAKTGYHLGVAIRTEGNFYLESSLLLANISQQYSLPSRDGITRPTSFANHTSIQIPLRVGFTTGKKKFHVRTAAGPVISYNVNTPSKNDIAPLIRADFNEFVLAAKVGLGFDIAFMTFDIDYQVGIDRVFEEEYSLSSSVSPFIYEKQTRNNNLFLTAGIKL